MSLKRSGPRRLKALLSEKGFTLIELMLVVAIMGIITPAITLIFLKSQQGMAADEMHGQLKNANEQAMDQIHERLSTGARLFVNDGFGSLLLNQVNRTGGAPAPVTQSQLPQIENNDSLSAGVSGFVAADIGNEIFFAANDSTQTIVNSTTRATTIYPCPATFTNLVDSASVTHTVVLNLFRFYYYYLTPVNSHGPAGVTTYQLVEWQSQPIADYNELNGISDATLLSNAVSALEKPVVTTSGPFAVYTGGVSYSWDDTATNPVTSFYQLQIGSPNQVAQTSVSLLQAQYNNLIYVTAGVLSNGFKWGIPPNSSQWGTSQQVPIWATASGSFPGGFEVVVAGNGAGRQVLVHSVLVAKGAAPQVAVNALTSITSVRDVW
jgi:prepilin-type N-terminal cleavage/methylation domain-containing protein